MKTLYRFILVAVYLQIYSQGIFGQFRDFEFVNDSIFYLVGNEGFIAKSIDRGETWFFLSSGYSNNMLFIDFINADLGWIYSGPKLLKTTDGGNNWTETDVMLSTKIFMIDSTIGWLAIYSEDEQLQKTTDGGTTWQIVIVRDLLFITDMSFIDAQRGWVAAASDEFPGISSTYIYSSLDGGVTWNVQWHETSSVIHSLYFVSPEVGWAVGHAGKVLKTTNSGQIWQDYPLPTDRDLNNVLFINSETGWIGGGWHYSGMDTIFITTDGGITWQTSSFGMNVRLFKFFDAQNGYAVRGNGTLLKSTDGGYTWSDMIITSTEDNENLNPSNWHSISQNYPNPFNPTTSLQYTVGSLQFVTIKVYDLLGREIATLINEEKPAGEYEVEFDGSGLTSGIYFYRIQAGSYSETRKMVLLK